MIRRLDVDLNIIINIFTFKLIKKFGSKFETINALKPHKTRQEKIIN